MDIPKRGTNQPIDMSSTISLAQNLERRERARLGCRTSARNSLANKLRVGNGTLENLIRGRVKKIDAALRDRLQALLIRELELEIGHLWHDLAIARQTGAPNHSDEITAVEEQLSQARAILERIVLGKGKHHVGIAEPTRKLERGPG